MLAVIRRHAASHRALAETDAYSAQEAPRLEATLAAVAALIEADVEFDAARAEFYAVARERETANERYMRQGRYIRAGKRRAAALARVQGAQR